ncbi:MAG: 3-phosphoshikimate 1-carboxyvinyltransferase [Clostridia bacterium]|nr:3-phosphoshikimate 1-carboxyvinyltransferase [Clostridia bacterium]
MRVEITPGVATGTVSAPNSKSMAHRMLICAALAKGKSVIHGVPECDDVTATMECLSLLGARFEYNKDTVTVYGTDVCNASPVQALYCKESGSTLRFLIPVCLLCGKNLLLTGAESLFRRPLDAYEELSREKGFVFSQDGNSVMLRGPITAGEYRISGSVSSQFISGLLFALPLLEKDSVVNIIPPVVSRPYIELTLQALKEFGVDACWTDDHTILVKGGKGFCPTETTVEGDYSGASFYAALNTLGGNVNILGLREDSLQGDKIYEKHFALLEQGIPTVHIGDCPDLGPVLFAVASAKYGGVFNGTSRLRFKESDRASAMAEELKKFGVSVAVHEDSVVVYPVEFHSPSEPLYGHNDHRIVMSLAVLLTLTGGVIDGAEAISKSFPHFFEGLSSLGIEVKYHDNK